MRVRETGMKPETDYRGVFEPHTANGGRVDHPDHLLLTAEARDWLYRDDRDIFDAPDHVGAQFFALLFEPVEAYEAQLGWLVAERFGVTGLTPDEARAHYRAALEQAKTEYEAWIGRS